MKDSYEIELHSKKIGRVSGETFYKTVKKSRHFFRKWKAWAVDAGLLDYLIEKGVRNILIHETEENAYYSATLQDFKEWGIHWDFGNGHGEQVFLPIANFKIAQVGSISAGSNHNLPTAV